MDFSVLARRVTTGVLLTVSGEIDIATAPEMRDALMTAFTDRPKLVQINMASVRFCDSTGLGALVAARNAAHERGARLELLDPSPPVRRLLALTALTDYFPISTASSPVTQV